MIHCVARQQDPMAMFCYRLTLQDYSTLQNAVGSMGGGFPSLTSTTPPPPLDAATLSNQVQLAQFALNNLGTPGKRQACMHSLMLTLSAVFAVLAAVFCAWPTEFYAGCLVVQITAGWA
jgi:hypothetical protein